ncbi:MAG: hypothetical protein OEY01_04730 [Desulfobulbaceae bacterium]|nr:hypothetical protein [Desulfobulbaceae bacterium]HIJ78478.1 hypothetical protein [Deltaproteobacteria bacterium]
MAKNIIPVEGNWYKSLDTGETLSVVTFDEDEGIVEVQYYDGDLDEIDIEQWEELSLKQIDQPEDFLGDDDDLDDDDAHYDMDDMDSDQWGDPLLDLDD